MLEFNVAIDALADDRQAVIPELALCDVDTEAFGKFGGRLFAGGGKQVFVIFHEARAALFVNGI